MPSRKSFQGIKTHFSYDSAGRLIAEQKENLLIKYFYDALGRLTRTQKPLTTYIQEFDYLAQLIAKRTEDHLGNLTFQEQYPYDAAGNKTHTITQGNCMKKFLYSRPLGSNEIGNTYASNK